MSGSSKNLGLQEQQQQQSNWCWAATTVSITLYYQPGLGLTQCQLVNRALGMSSCCQAPLGWDWQTLTGGGGGNTDGPPAAGDPAVVSYNDQMHVCYRDTSGLIQDAWYDGHGNWNLQQLTGGGNTDGPTAVGNPAPVSYGDQMHVCYRDTSGSLLPGVAAGLIQDAWYIGSTCNVPGEPDEALTITGHFASDTGSLPLSGSGGLFSSSVINEIDGKRPISIGILWNSGSAIGHNPSIEGYDTFGIPTIDIQDPLHGFSIQDFHTFPSTYFGGATWAQSFLTRP